MGGMGGMQAMLGGKQEGFFLACLLVSLRSCAVVCDVTLKTVCFIPTLTL